MGAPTNQRFGEVRTVQNRRSARTSSHNALSAVSLPCQRNAHRQFLCRFRRKSLPNTEQHTFLLKSADNTLIPWSSGIVKAAAQNSLIEAAIFRLPKSGSAFIERGANVLLIVPTGAGCQLHNTSGGLLQVPIKRCGKRSRHRLDADRAFSRWISDLAKQAEREWVPE
jgi:hypothetical protein